MKLSQPWIYCSVASFCFRFTYNEKSMLLLHYSARLPESVLCTTTPAEERRTGHCIHLKIRSKIPEMSFLCKHLKQIHLFNLCMSPVKHLVVCITCMDAHY